MEEGEAYGITVFSADNMILRMMPPFFPIPSTMFPSGMHIKCPLLYLLDLDVVLRLMDICYSSHYKVNIAVNSRQIFLMIIIFILFLLLGLIVAIDFNSLGCSWGVNLIRIR